jgi:transposase
MKFRDSRTIPPEQLYECRKQAVALRKKGMIFIEITKIVGVRRDVVGRWYAMWQDGGMKALKVSPAGAPKRSGLRLNPFEQERIRKNLIEKSPDQLKMPFALWTRDAVRLLVKEIYGMNSLSGRSVTISSAGISPLRSPSSEPTNVMTKR